MRGSAGASIAGSGWTAAARRHLDAAWERCAIAWLYRSSNCPRLCLGRIRSGPPRRRRGVQGHRGFASERHVGPDHPSSQTDHSPFLPACAGTYERSVSPVKRIGELGPPVPLTFTTDIGGDGEPDDDESPTPAPSARSGCVAGVPARAVASRFRNPRCGEGTTRAISSAAPCLGRGETRPGESRYDVALALAFHLLAVRGHDRGRQGPWRDLRAPRGRSARRRRRRRERRLRRHLDRHARLVPPKREADLDGRSSTGSSAATRRERSKPRRAPLSGAGARRTRPWRRSDGTAARRLGRGDRRARSG